MARGKSNTPEARARWHHFGLIGSARFAQIAMERILKSVTATPLAKERARFAIEALEAARLALAAERVTAHDEEYFR